MARPTDYLHCPAGVLFCHVSSNGNVRVIADYIVADDALAVRICQSKDGDKTSKLFTNLNSQAVEAIKTLIEALS